MDILKLKNEDGTWTSIPAIQGTDGTNGKDGISPTATVTQTTTGATITITDTNGTTTADITNGKDGSEADVPIATVDAVGKVKPDGTTITVDADGTIKSVGGGGGSGKRTIFIGNGQINSYADLGFANGQEMIDAIDKFEVIAFISGGNKIGKLITNVVSASLPSGGTCYVCAPDNLNNSANLYSFKDGGDGTFLCSVGSIKNVLTDLNISDYVQTWNFTSDRYNSNFYNARAVLISGQSSNGNWVVSLFVGSDGNTLGNYAYTDYAIISGEVGSQAYVGRWTYNGDQLMLYDNNNSPFNQGSFRYAYML